MRNPNKDNERFAVHKRGLSTRRGGRNEKPTAGPKPDLSKRRIAQKPARDGNSNGATSGGSGAGANDGPLKKS